MQKKRTPWLLLILAAVAIVLTVVVIVIYQNQTTDPDQTRTTTAPKIPLAEGTMAQITEISCTYDGKTWGFTRIAGTWFADWEEEFPLNQTAVIDLCDTIVGIRADSRVADRCDDPANFGLDAPHTVITVTIDGKTVRYAFGKQNYLKENAYYCQRSEDDALYLVSSETVEKLQKRETDFADLISRVPELERENVTGYTLQIADGTPIKLTEKADLDAVFTAVQKLVKALNRTSMEKFADYAVTEEEKNAYGLVEGQQVRLTIHYQRAVTKTLDDGTIGSIMTPFEATVYFGNAVEEGTYCLPEDSRYVYYVETSFVKETLPSLFEKTSET